MLLKTGFHVEYFIAGNKKEDFKIGEELSFSICA